MYGCTAPPWIGPGRTSATWIVRSSRFSGRVRRSALHLGAALDLKDADGVRALDLAVDGLVVERDPREVDRLAVQARDLLDAVLDRREHPEPEQVDLEEARVGARVLVPLADLPPLHRGRLDRDELDERPCRRSTIPPGCCEMCRGRPPISLRELARRRASAASRAALAVGQLRDLLARRDGVAVGDAREPLQLGERAGRAPCRRRGSRRARGRSRRWRRARRARGRSARRRATISFSRMSRGKSRSMSGTEASSRFRKPAEREVGVDRVDVREPGQVADDRADRAAAAAAGRERVARGEPGRAPRRRTRAPARAPPSGAGRSPARA